MHAHVYSPPNKIWLPLELAKSIGCPYISELEVLKGAKYTSHKMIDDFLAVLWDCVETTVLNEVH